MLGFFGKKSEEEIGFEEKAGGKVNRKLLLFAGGGLGFAGVIVLAGLLMGGSSAPSPSPPPPPPAPSPPVVEKEPPPSREEEKKKEVLPEASPEDMERDVFVEFYIEKLKEMRKEKEGRRKEVLAERRPVFAPPPSPPPAAVVRREEDSRVDEILEALIKQNLEEVEIESIVCSSGGCVAYTNFGVIQVGDRIGPEKVIKITPSYIETDRRVIRW